MANFFDEHSRAAAQKAEEARLRAAEDMYRSRSFLDSIMERSKRVTDRMVEGTSAAAFVAGATISQGYQYYNRFGPWGAASVSDTARSFTTSFGQALGLSNALNLPRGIPSGYFAASSSFGGLLSETGLGSIPFQLTGGLYGRDPIRALGFNPALVQSRAQAELSLRVQNIGNTFLSALPLTSRTSLAFRGIEEDVQRNLAQRLSFVNTAGRAGSEVNGVGFRSNSDFVESAAKSVLSEVRNLNVQRGYGLQNDEAKRLIDTSSSLFTEVDTERAVRRGDYKEKIIGAFKTTSALKKRFNMEMDEIEKLVSDVRGALSFSAAESFLQAPSQRFGGFSDGQAKLIQLNLLKEGMAAGFTQSGALTYAKGAMTRGNSLYESAIRGEIDPATYRMFGGSGGADSAVLFQAGLRNIGTQVGMGDSNLRTLYYSNPEGVSSLNRGSGLIAHLASASAATLRNPFASRLAAFDPTTQSRMMESGAFSAYSLARAKGALVGSLFGGNSEAVEAAALEEFQQRTGQGPMETRRLYNMYRDRENSFETTFGAGTGARAAALYESLSNASPSMTPESFVDLVRSGRLSLDTDIGNISSARISAMTPAANRADIPKIIKNRIDSYSDAMTSAPYWTKMVSSHDVQQTIDSLIASGMSVKDINQELQRSGAGSQFNVGSDSRLRVWSALGASDKKERFVDVSQVPWASNLGDDSWQNTAFSGLIKAIKNLHAKSGSKAAIAMQQTGLLSQMGPSADAFFRGVSEGTFADRVDAMLSGSFVPTNDIQKSFRSRYGGDLTGDMLSQDGKLTRDVIAALAHTGEDVTDLVKLASEGQWAPVASGLKNKGLDDDYRSLVAVEFARANQSALTALTRRGESHAFPLFVTVTNGNQHQNGVGGN